MKAVIDDKIPYIRGQIELLVESVVYMPGRDITADVVHDADILIVRTRTRCDRRLLQGSSVRLIVTATIGYDHIDTAYCQSAGISWTNCPGCNAASVCRYVMNALTVTHRLQPGLTVGIVGVGHVGTLVAQAALDHGMHVLLCDPPRRDRGDTFARHEWTDMERIAAGADIITFHTPLTAQPPYPTHHLADSAFFHSLQRKPLIINASRGAVVDNAALLAGIDEGLVADAVIDTWEGEPDHLNLDLLKRVAIGTPHIAGYSANGKANATRMSLMAVARFLGVGFTPCISLPPAERLTPDTLVADSASLKQQPQAFESLREHYPVRVE